MPTELAYVKHMKKKYGIELVEKTRFALQKQFEIDFHAKNDDLKHKFRKLENIEDIDEKQESMHAIRQKFTSLMLDPNSGLKTMG